MPVSASSFYCRAIYLREAGILADKSHKNQTRLKATEAEARRDFLKRIGKATATAPAVALLLAASAKSASAQSQYAPGDGVPGDGIGSCIEGCVVGCIVGFCDGPT